MGEQCQFYSDITCEKIEWLWYPYIPFGKITLLQGDPGDGKSTLMMEIIATVTTGKRLPGGKNTEPANVIFQCSEDSLSDTIKPRLEKAKADCKRVAYITEDSDSLSLDDEEIRNAIVSVKAKLLVVDPFQAYIGDADMSNACSMRRVLRRLSMWASTYNCAIVLIGHLNKKSGSKELYRGLGSIDVVATARSVLQIERDTEDSNIRTIKHVKSSLSQKGNDISFTISDCGTINWIDLIEFENAMIDFKKPESETPLKITKQERAARFLKKFLSQGPVEVLVLQSELSNIGIGKKTSIITKETMGLISIRKNGKWYWSLPNIGEKNGKEI